MLKPAQCCFIKDAVLSQKGRRINFYVRVLSRQMGVVLTCVQ